MILQKGLKYSSYIKANFNTYLNTFKNMQMQTKMECDVKKYNKSIFHRTYLRQQLWCLYLYWFPMELKDLHRRLSAETKNENIGIRKME